MARVQTDDIKEFRELLATLSATTDQRTRYVSYKTIAETASRFFPAGSPSNVALTLGIGEIDKIIGLYDARITELRETLLIESRSITVNLPEPLRSATRNVLEGTIRDAEIGGSLLGQSRTASLGQTERAVQRQILEAGSTAIDVSARSSNEALGIVERVNRGEPVLLLEAQGAAARNRTNRLTLGEISTALRRDLANQEAFFGAKLSTVELGDLTSTEMVAKIRNLRAGQVIPRPALVRQAVRGGPTIAEIIAARTRAAQERFGTRGLVETILRAARR